MRLLRYLGGIYRPMAATGLYTLEVQHRIKDTREIHKKLFDLIGRTPDKKANELGAMEMSWSCRNEDECKRFQKAILLWKVPGIIVDYYPTV